MIVAAAMTIATIVRTPTFNSDQASDRVRGIVGPSGQEFLQVCVLRRAERVGVSLEAQQAVAQHQELSLALLLGVGLQDLDLALLADGRMRGDVEGVAQLVRDKDGADALQV